jgi:phage baseplate assembly protein W
MGIQMTIPFTVLQNGAVSVESDVNVQTLQRVNAVVGTELGSRAMRANMGLPLSRLLFESNDNLVSGELTAMVTQQLNQFEPGVNILSVTPIIDQTTDGIAQINVNYAPILQASKSATAANVVTIQVGGTVTEVTAYGTS